MFDMHYLTSSIGHRRNIIVAAYSTTKSLNNEGNGSDLIVLKGS